ncbi:proliferating cell nuclear antigen [Schizopora paradoxa]|uniref:DNA sliding clamp PCNA n=1 Tax=Schizopora paradoxa TaxID=27342 RepID=A0A0H2RIJ6_9AGAM|nr:proliferating cell nuclear antigen [Schizopora paradoxa]
MLEAKLADAVLLKRLLDSIKELVTDANFECTEEGLKLQAMDNSHVALVAVLLKEEGFMKYRCDRPIPLGVNLGSLTKVLKCAKDDDVVTLKAGEEGDILQLTYEGRNSDRIADYEMKLMDIDADQLGIPDTEYDARVTMSSAELSRIVKDLAQLGESVRIDVSKDGVRFEAEGESANGKVLLKQTEAARRRYAEDEEEVKNEGDDDDEKEEGGSKRKKVKKEKKENGVKKENEDAEMEDGEKEGEDESGEFKAESDDEGEEEKEEGSDEEQENRKKRKKAQAKATGKSKRAKKSNDDEDGDASGGVSIEMNQHVSLTFSLKYLVNFAKSAALSNKVKLMMSSEVPLLVSYDFGPGHIHYYLAPKIGDE